MMQNIEPVLPPPSETTPPQEPHPSEPVPQPVQPAPEPPPQEYQPSYFFGTTLQLLGWRLLGILLSLITLGIGTPWAQCMVIRWETKHTCINGQQLYFDGKGHQLLGKYLLWGFLTLITVGIYAIFIPVRMHKWRAGHTRFARQGDDMSGLSGGVIFGIVMAFIAFAAVIAMAVMYFTPTSVRPTPLPSDGFFSDFFQGEEDNSRPGEMEGFVSGGTGMFIIDNGDGTYSYVYQGAQGNSWADATDSDWEYIPEDNSDSSEYYPEDNSDNSEYYPDDTQGSSSAGGSDIFVPDSITGQWVMCSRHAALGACATTLTFNEDGTFSDYYDSYNYSSFSDSPYWYGEGIVDDHSKGTYTYTGGELIMHYTQRYENSISSEPGYWMDCDYTSTRQVTCSEDGSVLYISGDFISNSEMETALSGFHRAYGSVDSVLSIYFPDYIR